MVAGGLGASRWDGSWREMVAGGWGGSSLARVAQVYGDFSHVGNFDLSLRDSVSTTMRFRTIRTKGGVDLRDSVSTTPRRLSRLGMAAISLKLAAISIRSTSLHQEARNRLNESDNRCGEPQNATRPDHLMVVDQHHGGRRVFHRDIMSMCVSLATNTQKDVTEITDAQECNTRLQCAQDHKKGDGSQCRERPVVTTMAVTPFIPLRCAQSKVRDDATH